MTPTSVFFKNLIKRVQEGKTSMGELRRFKKI